MLNFKGHLWNFTQNFETIHCKICMLLKYYFCLWFTISWNCDVISLSEMFPRCFPTQILTNFQALKSHYVFQLLMIPNGHWCDKATVVEFDCVTKGDADDKWNSDWNILRFLLHRYVLWYHDSLVVSRRTKLSRNLLSKLRGISYLTHWSPNKHGHS